MRASTLRDPAHAVRSPSRELARLTGSIASACRQRRLASAMLFVIGFDLALATGEARQPSALVFPNDAHLINVHDFGAVGDGRHDDTEALQKAIDYATLPFQKKGPIRLNATIVLPEGIYLVSDTLDYGRQADLAKRTQIQGAGSDRTIIRLRDHAANFQSADRPKAVVSTFSGNWTNQAFFVQIDNLTVDVGKENPGANGIHFVANNVGGMTDVRINGSGSAGVGSIGLDLSGLWVGPALFEDVTIQGFDIGILTTSMQYGVTFKDIFLSKQRDVGLLNEANSLTIDGLHSHNAVPAVRNREAGFIALVRGRLDGEPGTDRPAIENDGHSSLHMVDVAISGYPPANEKVDSIVIGSDAPRSLAIVDGHRQNRLPQFDLPNPTFDQPPPEPPNRWARAEEFTGDGVQRAMDSGRSTIYLPTGRYILSLPLTIPPTVRRVIGFASNLKLDKNFPAGTPVITVDPRRQESLVLERLDLWSGAPPDTVWIFNESRSPLMIRDSILDCIGYRGKGDASSAADTVSVFFKNVGGIKQMTFDRQNAVAWQLNPEGRFDKVEKIVNIGSRLTVYGLKTEGTGALVKTVHGATTVFGGLDLVNFDIPKDAAMFDIEGGRSCISTVEITNNPKNRGYTRYTVLMGSTDNHTQLRMTADYPERNASSRVYAAVCAP